MSDAKKTIEINDRETAKAAAEMVEIKWPVAQGKPPKSALYNKLTELGFEVKGSYLPKPKPKLPAVPAGKREYEITRTHTGKPNSKGDRKALANPETIRVSIGELRAILHAEGMKGSLGDSRIREAVSKLREAKKLFVGWEDVDIAKADIVPVVGAQGPDANVLAILRGALTPEPAKPAAKAPVKPRTPRNSRAKGKETTPAVSVADTATETVTAAAAE